MPLKTPMAAYASASPLSSSGVVPSPTAISLSFDLLPSGREIVMSPILTSVASFHPEIPPLLVGTGGGGWSIAGNHIPFHPHPASPIEGEEKFGAFPDGN